MAIVEKFIASLQLGDSNKGSLHSGAVTVGAVDARAYLAAANQAARDATKVGLLLDSMIDVTRAVATNYYKKYSVQADFINDTFEAPDKDLAIYGTNKWKVTFRTTNGGVPAVDTIYIPEYLVAGVIMADDGISANLEEDPILNLCTQLIDTGLSKYNTAITSIISIQRNDK